MPTFDGTFESALYALKQGQTVTRRGWNGREMSLKAQYPDEGSANTLPYIYIILADGGRVPWLASQSDLFGEDWEIVE